MVLARELKLKNTAKVLFPAGTCINEDLMEILHLFTVEEKCRIIVYTPQESEYNNGPLTALTVLTPSLPDKSGNISSCSFLFVIYVLLERESAALLLHCNERSAQINSAGFIFYHHSFWMTSLNDLIPKTVIAVNKLFPESIFGQKTRVIPWNLLSLILEKKLYNLPIKAGEEKEWERYSFLTALYRLNLLKEPYSGIIAPPLLMP